MLEVVNPATERNPRKMTPAQIALLQKVVSAIKEAVKAGGPLGTPGGTLYAALMAHGCTLSQFETIVGGMVKAQILKRRGDLYFA
jgi:hypothetical protein